MALDKTYRYVTQQLLRIKICLKALPYASTRCGGYRELIERVWQTYKHEGVSGIKRRVLLAASLGAPSPLYYNDYDEWVRRYDTLTDQDRDKIKKRIDDLKKKKTAHFCVDASV